MSHAPPLPCRALWGDGRSLCIPDTLSFRLIAQLECDARQCKRVTAPGSTHDGRASRLRRPRQGTERCGAALRGAASSREAADGDRYDHRHSPSTGPSSRGAARPRRHPWARPNGSAWRRPWRRVTKRTRSGSTWRGALYRHDLGLLPVRRVEEDTASGMVLSRCFAPMSAAFSAVEIFSVRSTFPLTNCERKRHLIWTCCMRPKQRWRCDGMPATESLCTTMSHAAPSSAIRRRRARVSHAPLPRAYDSASALENATDACVLPHEDSKDPHR